MWVPAGLCALTHTSTYIPSVHMHLLTMCRREYAWLPHVILCVILCVIYAYM